MAEVTQVGRGWRWWVTEASPVDARRVESGEPIALIGGVGDALRAWAQVIGPERRVLDLQGACRPTVGTLRKVFEGAAPIVLAGRPEQVVRALGLAYQPYMIGAIPAAILMAEGNMTAAASKIGITRQALGRWFVRRR